MGSVIIDLGTGADPRVNALVIDYRRGKGFPRQAGVAIYRLERTAPSSSSKIWKNKLWCTCMNINCMNM